MAATERGRSSDNQRISGFVDIHAHVLPGVDDGPPDLEQSLAMARSAVASGISQIAATPHLRPDFPRVRAEEIGERCTSLRGELSTAGIPLDLVSGAEISLTWALEASDEDLRLASYGQRGTDLLIEMPFTHVLWLDRFLYQLQAKGYRITLAHPERHHTVQRGQDFFRALVEDGILLQLNADSILQSRRRRTRRVAEELLAEGLAHVIASDGHGAASWRPVTRLEEAVEAAASVVGAARAEWMATEAPAAIVSGSALSIPPDLEKRPAGARFLRLW